MNETQGEHKGEFTRKPKDYQAGVHSGQMVLVVVRQEGWTMWMVAKEAQMKVGKNTLGSQGNY